MEVGDSFICTCKFGLEDKANEGQLGARLNCVDRNECVEGVRHGESTVAACDPVRALCVNKDMLVDEIPYTCKCYEGWESKADIAMADYKTGCKDCCTDVDECEDAEANCGPNAGSCVNTLGSFSCTCKFGLEDKVNEGKLGARLNCVDRNECVEGVRHGESTVAACDPAAALCVNKDMLVDEIPYTCQCYEGWESKADIDMADYKTGCKDCCTDVDECANGTHHCNDICENRQPGYTCACNPDRYPISKLSCADCSYGAWLPWGPCSEPCGLGKKTRYPVILSPPENHPLLTGDVREACSKKDVGHCLVTFCGDTPCKYTSWNSWTECTHACGSNGLKSRTRLLAEGTAEGCKEPLEESRPCNRHNCDIGSIFTTWWMITIMAVAGTAIIVSLAWLAWKYYKKTKSEDSAAVHVPPPEPSASERRPSVQSFTTSARPRPRRPQRRGRG